MNHCKPIVQETIRHSAFIVNCVGKGGSGQFTRVLDRPKVLY